MPISSIGGAGATGPMHQPDNTPKMTEELNTAWNNVQHSVIGVLNQITNADTNVGQEQQNLNSQVSEFAQEASSDKDPSISFVHSHIAEAEHLADEEVQLNAEAQNLHTAAQQIQSGAIELTDLVNASVQTGNPSQTDVASALTSLNHSLGATTDIQTQADDIASFVSTHFPDFKAQ